MYTILFDDASTFSDLSLTLKDYLFNTADITPETADYLYIGYYKKFNSFYVELSTLNTISSEITVEYYNGSAWTELSVTDESKDFTQSGFMYWDRPENWAAATIDSKEKFYIRIKWSANHDAATTLKGLGVLFSNDLDLIGIRSNIVSKLNSGNSWIGKHEAARKWIIQRIRNLGNVKVITDESDSNPVFAEGAKGAVYANVTEFDLHDPFELREASKFYTLAMIYLDELTDEIDDKWERNGLRHMNRAEEALNLFMLKLDTNDNGEEDEAESEGDTGINLSWE